MSESTPAADLRVDHRSVPERPSPNASRATVLAIGLSIFVHAAAFAGIIWYRSGVVPAQVFIVSLAELDSARAQGPENPVADVAPPEIVSPPATDLPDVPATENAPLMTAVPVSEPEPKMSQEVRSNRSSVVPQSDAASAPDQGLSGGAQSQPRYSGTGLSNPPPKYPFSARRRGQEGEVVLRVLVDEIGRAQQVDMHRSSGFRSLDQAALDAVGDWQFVPARDAAGRPIAAIIDVPIAFRLTGE